MEHLPYTFLLVMCLWVSALRGLILLLSGMFAHSPFQKRPQHCARTHCAWRKGAVCLLWTNGFVLHWENWSQDVKSVFFTGIDCSFPKGTGFYFVVPEQNCSHTVKQDSVLAVSEHRCFGGVDVVPSLLQRSLPGGEDETRCAASASSMFDPARLFQGVWK